MLKRFGAFLLTGVMALSMLGGAVVSAEEPVSETAAGTEEKEEISKDGKRIIQWLSTYLDTSSGAQILHEYVDQYNAAHDDVYVEIVDAAFATTVDYYEALAINAASGEPYEIFSMSATYFDKYVNSGTAMNVDDYILNNDDVKDYAKEAVMRDGHAYAFPASNDVIGLFVNLEMLEGAGHTVDDLATWDGMLEAAADISNTYGNYGCLTNLGFGGGYAEFLWYATLWSAGGGIEQDMDGNIIVTNPEGVATAAMQYRDLITSDSGSTEFGNNIDYLIAGTCGMDIMGQDGLYVLDEGFDRSGEGGADFEWTFLPIPPKAEGGQAYSPLGGWTIMVNNDSDEAQAAAEFLNWLYFESDCMVDRCENNFQLSPLVSADEKLDSLYVDTKFSLAYDLISEGKIECRAELAFDSQVLEAIGKMLSSVIYETSTDEEAMACVQTFIDTVGATVVEG